MEDRRNISSHVSKNSIGGAPRYCKNRYANSERASPRGSGRLRFHGTVGSGDDRQGNNGAGATAPALSKSPMSFLETQRLAFFAKWYQIRSGSSGWLS